MNQFRLGAVLKLTREDTLTDIEKNFAGMKDAGFNTCVVWPAAFWWEEKTEFYPFNTGRELLKIAERMGIDIIMELAGQLTVMEYIPDFLMKPEYYARDVNGNVERWADSFGFLSYFHPEVNELICEHFKKAARAYREFPALVAYDVFNETMFRSFDEPTINEFRVWLREKYGTIENLNRVWERTYTEFGQVDYQTWKWMSIMPMADWNAFKNDTVKRFLKKWCDALRSEDRTHALISDNIHSQVTGVTYGRPQDDYGLKEVVDEIGMSFYPKQSSGTLPPERRWEIFDAYYDASGREGYCISEMQTHLQTLLRPTTAVRPNELRTWCAEAVSGGATGIIYWMWRPFTKGLQTLGRGLVDYKNRSTVRLEAASEFGRIMKETGPLKPRKAKAAVVYDPVSEHMQNALSNDDKLLYCESIYGIRRSMYDCDVPCDIIRFDEIDGYSVIFLTSKLVLTHEECVKLRGYVENGGVVICDGKTGIIDENSMLLSELPGGEANDLFGWEFMDADYTDLAFRFGGKEYDGFFGRDLAELRGGECIAQYSDGHAAVIRKRYGKGEVISITSYHYYGYAKNGSNLRCLTETVAEKYGLRTYSVTSPLKVRICENDGYIAAFVFNYTDAEVCGSIRADGIRRDVTVPANDVVIITEAKK